MADEDLLGEMEEMGGEIGEEEAEGEAEEAAAGVSLMRYLPLVAVILVVQIVIAYFIVQWVFTPDEPEEGEVAATEEVAPEPEPESEPAQAVVSVIYEKLDPIVINPAGTEGLRYLSTTIHFGVSSPEVVAMIEGKNQSSKIRDVLIRVLSAKTIAQLQPENHAALKDEIQEKLNGFLGKNAVLEVYFQGFVLQ